MTYGLAAYATDLYGGPEAAAASAGTLPAVAVEFKLNGVWTDIGTARWSSGSVSRIRRNDLQRYGAGRASVLLRNENRDFDPTYTSSPFYPYIRPSLPVRIRSTYAGVTYPLFTGTVDAWNLNYDMPNVATVELQASDDFKRLARAELSNSVWEATIRYQGGYRAWYRLSDPKGAPAQDVGPSGYHGTYSGTPDQQASSIPVREPDGSCRFDGIDDYVSLPNAAGLAGTSWTVEAWVQAPTFDSANVRVFFAQGVGTADRIYIGVRPSNLASPGRIQCTVNGMADLIGVTNVLDLERVHVVLVRDGSSVSLYVNGALEATGSTSGTTTAQNTFIGRYLNGTLYWLGYADEVVLWDTSLTATQVALHYEGGSTPLNGDTPAERINQILDWVAWPADARELETGASILQSTDLGGNALDYLQKVAESENGALYVAGDGSLRFLGRQYHMTNTTSLDTYGDGAGEIGYTDLDPDYADDTILAIGRVSRLGGVQQEYTDSAAKTEFGPQGIERQGLLHNSDSVSRDHASFLVNLYKDPQLRFVQLRMRPPRDNAATLFPVALGRRLQDRVTVKRRPPGGGSAITQASIVEGIEHRFAPMDWQTTLVLSSARTQAYWLAGVAGNSEAGTTTRAGY